MKKILLLFSAILFFARDSFSQREKDSIHASITRFFDGISDINADNMRACTTSDFTLLEEGEVWILDTLISKISARKNSGIQRVNSFEFIKTEQMGNIAWVSYYNTADFSLNEKKQTVKWLESVVLLKEKGKWKIKLMHSTRIIPPKTK